MAPKVIYITGFRQHAGKTVTCLGLLYLLTKVIDPERIGYIKPVGQEIVELADNTEIDKDARIIRQFAGIPDLDMNYISPVRLAAGFTKEFLDSKDKVLSTKILKDDILKSIKSLSHKDIIIAEGTGHPGVGSIVGLSNAKVSKLIDAEIIFLSGGGIGKALDMLEVDLSYFMYKQSRVRGIIFNKLIPDKIPTVKKYITEELLNERYGSFGGSLHILGCLPQIDGLSNPSMRVIKDAFPDAECIGDFKTDAWKIPCTMIRVITLPDEKFVPGKRLYDGSIVIIAASSTVKIIKIINYNRELKKINQSIGGFIFTCEEEDPLDIEIKNQIIEDGIPALSLRKDSATTEADILKVFENTKLQEFDEVKIKSIKTMFDEHFDLDKFLHIFKIRYKG